MSITVNFSSGSKRENSTKQLSMDSSHSCNFKNGCSMLNPTLLLELHDNQFPNYTAFKIGNRYYLLYSGSGTRYATYANGIAFSEKNDILNVKDKQLIIGENNEGYFRRKGLFRRSGV